MDFRNEQKYIVTDAQLTLLRARIRPLLCNDSHQCCEGGYRVRSVYFDDLDDRFLAANFAGLDDRGIDADRARKDVSHRVMQRFGLGDLVGLEQMTHLGVVARDLPELALARQIDPAVADMGRLCR